MKKLVVIMRSDLWDMNPGKMAAQACHAQADFTDFFVKRAPTRGFYDVAYNDWKEDRSFGTTIVCSATLAKMYDIVVECSELHYGVVTDPTYPYRNFYGELFTSEEVTCMWVFVDEEVNIQEDQYLRANAPLHR